MKLIQYLSLNVLQTEILVPNPWRIDVALDLLEKPAGEKFCFLSPSLTDSCLEQGCFRLQREYFP